LKSTFRENRIFAITLAGGFLLVALLALLKERQAAAAISFGLSVASLLAGLLVPGRLGAARRGWMKIGEGLSFVTTPILMAAVYYLVFTPPAMLRRFRRRRRAKRATSWEQRAPLPPASRMERQF
jgi:peptidoglycan biosynthesis protein MviN/MurJ (putative lipid II flippase)